MTHYEKTILKMMMYYPTIFPTEFHCQNHLFLVIGTGYEWNKKGQLVDTLGVIKKIPDRSRKSVLPNIDKDTNKVLSSAGRMFFNSIGDNFTHLYYWSQYSRLDYILQDKVIPAKDWKTAIEWFCYKINHWSVDDYKRMMIGHYICYGLVYNNEIKRDLNEFKIIKKNCEKLLKKLEK